MPNTNTTQDTTTVTLLELFETKNKEERRLFKWKFKEFAGITADKNFYERINGKKELTAAEAKFVAEWFEVPIEWLLKPSERALINKIPAVRGKDAEYGNMKVVRNE